MFKFFKRLFRRRRIFDKPMPITFGAGLEGASRLHRVLTGNKADATRARNENYRRSVRRLLDCASN